MEKTITVFTPTYNRAHTLVRTYESLCRQTSSDFEWLIVDDGSTDKTEEIVQEWILENRISIKYIKKENGGLHTGYNTAIANIESELCVCIDSDDFMPDDAVENILRLWMDQGDTNLAGIIGLDFYIGGDKPIGGYFRREGLYHFLNIGQELRHYGDTKMILRTSLLKNVGPMISFENEKNFNPIYLYYKIDPNLKYITVNKNFCYVDYQPSGMAANILHQYRNSPRSFAELRKVSLNHPLVSSRRKIRDSIHLVSSAMLARDLGILKGPYPKKYLLFTFPLGVLLYIYILFNTRSHS